MLNGDKNIPNTLAKAITRKIPLRILYRDTIHPLNVVIA